MINKQVIAPTTAASLLTLLGINVGVRGAAILVLETPSTNTNPVLWGSSAAQLMSLSAAGDRIELPSVNLKNIYILGDGTDVLNVAVFRADAG